MGKGGYGLTYQEVYEMFFGYLAGNKTYTKALAVQKNYAASLDKTAKSTKKATKAAKDYLSPLDEINRYTTNKDTDTTPSGSDVNGTPISKMFEEVPIDAPPIFEKIKDVLGQIFQPFKEAWEREGKNTIELLSMHCRSLEHWQRVSAVVCWKSGRMVQAHRYCLPCYRSHRDCLQRSGISQGN